MLSAIKTEVSLESDDPAYQHFLLQQYEERIEKLSQQDKLRKFCMDAEFLSVVENGQYFLAKDTGDPRKTPKLGPYWEVATSYLHEVRIMSLSRVSRKVIYLLRHSQHVNREEDGAVQFWRIKENLQKYFLHSPHWSDSKWKVCFAGGGGNKKRFQYCIDNSGAFVYFRALQGHSGRNLIDPSLQDNVVVSSNFFQHIYHV